MILRIPCSRSAGTLKLMSNPIPIRSSFRYVRSCALWTESNCLPVMPKAPRGEKTASSPPSFRLATQAEMERLGYRVRRFSTAEVADNPIGVWQLIEKHLNGISSAA